MKRMTAPDSFKAIAAFMVIFIHVTAAPVTTLTSGCSYNLLLLVNRFSKPSVPMFLCQRIGFAAQLSEPRVSLRRIFAAPSAESADSICDLVRDILCMVYFSWNL